MTEEWMKRIQDENTHLKNQIRLLKENYELRAFLGQQCENNGQGQFLTPLIPPAYPDACLLAKGGQYLGTAFKKMESEVHQQPPLLENLNYSPHIIAKESLLLCNPSAQVQPKRLHNDPPPFQLRSGEKKLAPLTSMSCSTIGRKQLEEFTDVTGLKKPWLTDSPGGDKVQNPFPLSIAYYKAGRLLGSKDTSNHLPSWTEETAPSNPTSTPQKDNAQAQAVFSNDPRIPKGVSSSGISDRQGYHIAGSALESRTDKALPASEEMPRKKHVWFSDAPVTDRQRKLHTFHLSDLEIAQNNKKNGRIVGEIAFQLDRRILAHVFPGITRLYGFTVCNIPEKIKQLSMKSTDGSVDEKKYRAMTQRYLDLTSHLEKMGYHTDIHPVFSEFLINTYGILKQRPDLSSNPLHNSPSDLRKMVIDIVPSKFLGDTLLLLNCLCELSKEDNKALFAW
ncbi:speriolin-like protein [Eublepharis macularius]|uniref:Speriolin-like protein n=1 Tax=Eublepharis macularius TaxID=481883 RepID=A0AA97KBR5_EUBMA|nr:speriolin-like protein [Eublepharis macularius]